MKVVTVPVLVVCLLLVGCASSLVYRHAPTPNDYGYRDRALTDTRFRVSFSGGYGVARETVENLALFRAAQVTLSHGARRFRVISRNTQSITGYSRPVTTIGYGFGDIFWATGITISNTAAKARYQSVLEIRIGSGVPAHGPDVYRAMAVKRHLAALANSARQ